MSYSIKTALKIYDNLGLQKWFCHQIFFSSIMESDSF